MAYINPEELNLSDKGVMEVEYYGDIIDYIWLNIDPCSYDEWDNPSVGLDKQDVIKLAKLLKITGEDLKGE